VVQVITLATPAAVPNLVEIRLWWLLCKWVKYNELKKYLYLFSGTYLQMAQTTRTRARLCLFVVSLVSASHFAGEIPHPKNPNFWGVNRRFQAKTGKIL